MNDETVAKLTRAIELLTRKEEAEAKRAEENEKRNEMWKKIDEKVRPLRDAKFQKLNELAKENRSKEDKLHDKEETAISKIENAIRKEYGEPVQKPYLRLQNAINTCYATPCR